MPAFRPLDQDRIAELTRRSNGGGPTDLSDQKDWISRAVIEANGWGEVQIEDGDNVRAIKRRTTIAGKELKKVVKWHRKSTPTQLIFRAIDPSQVVHRPRLVRVDSQETNVIEKPRQSRSKKKLAAG